MVALSSSNAFNSAKSIQSLSKRKALLKPSQSTYTIRQLLLLLIVFLTGCFFSSTLLLIAHPSLTHTENVIHQQQDFNEFTNVNQRIKTSTRTQQHDVLTSSNNLSSSANVLNGKRILIAIASFDFSQFPLLEEVLDSYQSLCFAGASRVDIYIHTTVPYTVALIDLLNTRLKCDSLQIYIVVKSPALRLNLVDCHRTLFYEKIDEYDLFVYSEVSENNEGYI